MKRNESIRVIHRRSSTIAPACLALCAGMFLAAAGRAQVVPEQITYHGFVTVNDTNFTGKGQFKFSLIEKPPFALVPTTHWTNDGTPAGEPIEPVTLLVTDGRFSVVLGDDGIPDMEPIPTDTFSHADLYLRVWFDDGDNGSVQLAPDQPMTSVGYAMMAAHVEDGGVSADAIAPDSIDSDHLADQSVATADLADGSVTTPKLADGAVTTPKLADNAVSGAKLQGNAVDSAHIVNNAVTSDDVADQLSLGELELGMVLGHAELSLLGPLGVDRGALRSIVEGSEFLLQHGDGDTGVAVSARYDRGGDVDVHQAGGPFGVRLQGGAADHSPNGGVGAGGRVTVHGREGTIGVQLDGAHENAGRVRVLYPNQTAGINLEGHTGRVTLSRPDGTATASLESLAGTGARLSLAQQDGDISAVLYAADPTFGVGALSLRDADGEARLRLFGGPQNGAFELLNDNALPIVAGWGTATGEGVLTLANQNGDERLVMWAAETDGTDGASLQLLENDGGTPVRTATLVANEGGELWLYSVDDTDSPSILIDADYDGESRIITDVLEITGGSDLSEQFDIGRRGDAAPEPGMLVSIDPARPGELMVSAGAYDRTVAGVISGAGGVKPGMLMGQQGSVADGELPVALTGRVYCRVDAGYGAVEPGDLITTSDTPGHGMKVADRERAHGAIIGKAMSGLDAGRGLVLILVSLH